MSPVRDDMWSRGVGLFVYQLYCEALHKDSQAYAGRSFCQYFVRDRQTKGLSPPCPRIQRK